MIYTLTKEKIKKGYGSAVTESSHATSKRLFVLREVDAKELLPGDEVFVQGSLGNFIKTSPLKEITEEEEGVYLLETRTSFYTLTEENEDE